MLVLKQQPVDIKQDGGEAGEPHKLQQQVKMLQIEVDRLRKLGEPKVAQADQAQQNNMTFRKMMRALNQAKMVIEYLGEHQQ